LVPNVLTKGAVLRLRLESRDVGWHFRSILETLASCYTDSTKAGAVLYLGLRGRGLAPAHDVGVIGISQHCRIGCGCLAAHKSYGTCLGQFARDGFDGVNIDYFSHFS